MTRKYKPIIDWYPTISQDIRMELLRGAKKILGEETPDFEVKFHKWLYQHRKSIIQDMMRETAEWYRISLTAAQCLDIIQRHNQLLLGIDTGEREIIMYDISKEVAGMNYPMNGDSDEYKKLFWRKFLDGALMHGYKIIFGDEIEAMIK